MSHESVPEPHRLTGQTGQAAHDRAHQEPAVPAQGGGAPKGLLQQMEEMMAALNADLSRLDADLQSSTERAPASGAGAGSETGLPAHRAY
ncbi:hypothetical protein ACFXB3_12180 [Streptomyces sp. NPDC059447]|uniref:hypothetical protein n=1 Tax=Streptomyces sp. NPDC059447 TaxID=3346834 RepID=UPI0036BD8340